ncbi:TPA: TSUP family transporter [Serratia marcescens]
MSLTLLEIIALTGIFTLAGTVKGAIGLGLPTVSMGLLSLMMPPGQAAALLLLPSLITNLWQLLRGARLGPLCGLVTGALTGATGVFVIPAVPYLNALGLARDDLVQALGLSFTVSTLALAAGLAWHQALPATLLGGSLLALLPALGGMWLGERVRRHCRPQLFRHLFFIGLLILGVEIIWRFN